MRFVGINVPEAGGSLLPALTPLSDYLSLVDPDALPFLQAAIRIADGFAHRSMALSAPAWARLGIPEQDTLAAALTRLRIRFRGRTAVRRRRPTRLRSGPLAARRGLSHRLLLPCHGRHLRRSRPPADASAREIYMAGSIRWHLEHSDPGARVVLAAPTPTSRRPRSPSTVVSRQYPWGSTWIACSATTTSRSA